jgi:hypothetical protein
MVNKSQRTKKTNVKKNISNKKWPGELLKYAYSFTKIV